MNDECITLSSDEEVGKVSVDENISTAGKSKATDVQKVGLINSTPKLKITSETESSNNRHSKDFKNCSNGESKAGVRKVALTSVTPTNKSDSKGKILEKPSENLRSRKDQSKPSGSSSNSGKDEESLEDFSFSAEDKYKLKKLENMLKKVNKKIKELEEAEVMSTDDEEENAYIQLDKYRKRASEIYHKICEISGKSADAERATRRKISFSGRRYPAVFRALERRYNKKKQFPDYHEVIKVVTRVNEREHLGHNKLDIPRIAREVFTEFGQGLQKLRMWDDYSIITEYLNDSDNDPALEDEDLQQKLNHNKSKYHGKENEVIDEFARKQLENKNTENNHEDEDKAEKKEEDDEDEDISRDGSQSRSESETETEDESKESSMVPSSREKKKPVSPAKVKSPVRDPTEKKEVEPSLFSSLGLKKNQAVPKEESGPSFFPSLGLKEKQVNSEEVEVSRVYSKRERAGTGPEGEAASGSSPKRRKANEDRDEDSQDCLIVEESAKEDQDSEKENNSKLDHRGSRPKSPAPNNCLKINNVISLGMSNIDWKFGDEFTIGKDASEKLPLPGGESLGGKEFRLSETSIIRCAGPEQEKEMSLHLEVVASDDEAGSVSDDSVIEFRPVSPSKEVPKCEAKEEDDNPKIVYIKNGPPPFRFITSSVTCSEVITLD